MDRVHDWMSSPVLTIDPGTSVAKARELMWGGNIRHLPVLQDGNLVGMVSERDVHGPDHAAVVALSSTQRAILAGAYRSVRNVMTTGVQTVWADDTIVYAASVMAQWKIGALPVVKGHDLVGIITTTDCMRALVALHRSTPADSASVD
jgi:acetoin utilization protein AcuB